MAGRVQPRQDLIEQCARLLNERWDNLQIQEPLLGNIPSHIKETIQRSVNSKIKTYRYVLPTQLLAKAADHALDCRSIQAGSGLTKSFDARTICHKVVVPFDRDHHGVLGRSPEPYVNNSLRIPAIVPAHRDAQKDPQGFDGLCTVLDFAQENPGWVVELLDAVLLEISSRLQETRLSYPVPNRISLLQAIGLLTEYLGEKSGGVRLQAVAVALFEIIGKRLQLFETVRSSKTNAADASTGSVADLECLNEEGDILLGVEVKDRQLTLRHIQDKLPGI